MTTPDASTTDLFLDLVRIPSPSGHERTVASFIRDWLGSVGVVAELDGTGRLNDSDAGNLIATLRGAQAAPSFLFVAHMDTVETGAVPIEPVVGADGVIRSSGETILGADNKSAVAAMMNLCRAVAAMPAGRRPTVHAAFTSREESGRMGASLLALADYEIDCAFCVDGSRQIGTVITRALGQTVFTAVIHGRTAHAAVDPAAGINAIRVAAEIVAALQLGRQEGGGSVNVAAVVAGNVVTHLRPETLAEHVPADGKEEDAHVVAALELTATNCVPDVAYVRGEARGYSEEAMRGTLDEIAGVVARVCDAHDASHELRLDLDAAIPPMPGMERSRALELFQAAAADVPGVEFRLQEGPATLEANYLAPLCDALAISSGGREPHQLSESIAVAELDQLAALLVRIVELGSCSPA